MLSSFFDTLAYILHNIFLLHFSVYMRKRILYFFRAIAEMMITFLYIDRVAFSRSL